METGSMKEEDNVRSEADSTAALVSPIRDIVERAGKVGRVYLQSHHEYGRLISRGHNKTYRRVDKSYTTPKTSKFSQSATAALGHKERKRKRTYQQVPSQRRSSHH